MAPALWDAIGDFCRLCVTDFGPTTLVKARHMMGVVQELAVWAHTNGHELIREDLLEEAMVLSYLKQFGEHQDRTRQSLLTELTRGLNDVDGIENIRIGKGPRANQPYTAREVGELYSWSQGQPSERRRHNATTILAFTLGAGLTCSELITLTTADITIDNKDATVHLADRAVPVLANWSADIIRVAADGLATDRLFITDQLTGTPHGILSDFIRRTRGITAKPTPARLRATWIVQQLQAGTPLDVIIGAAGFNDARSLERYLPFVHRSAADAAAYLRTAGGDK